MTRTGKFVSADELEHVKVALSCSGMFLSGGMPMGDPAHEVELLRRKYEMPEGYGIDTNNGEFVSPLRKGNDMSDNTGGATRLVDCAACGGAVYAGCAHLCSTNLQQQPAPSAQPETNDLCQKCGLPNPVWFAPNDVWNRLVPNRVGFICPTCFASLDFETTWVLIPEEMYDKLSGNTLAQPDSAEAIARARQWLEANGYSLWLTANSDSFPRCVADYAAHLTAALEKRVKELAQASTSS